GRRNHHLQRTRSRTLSRLSHLYAGAGEGAGAAAKRARDHRRRRRRQLWPLARAGGELARIHAERAGRPPRFAPRLLCRLAAVSAVSGGVAALLGACLSDLTFCALVVALGGDGGGVFGDRLAQPPVEEAIDGKSNGYLVDFFDADALAERVCSVLQEPAATAPIRAQARRHVI